MAEAPLSLEEAREILAAGPPGVLIGGMALAFWATYFEVEAPSALVAGVTQDLDFFGPSADAIACASRLQETVQAESIQVFTPAPGDVTPNTAKIVVHGIDLLEAVPVDSIPSDAFRSKRWPQIKAHVGERRARILRQQMRRESLRPLSPPRSRGRR